MKQNDGQEIFGAFRAPRVPEDLKRKILDAGGEAIDRPSDTTLWDVLWESRVARAAWIATTLILIVAHIGISFPADSRLFADRANERNQMDELKDELDLPSVEISPRAEARVMGATPSAARETESKNDPENNEV